VSTLPPSQPPSLPSASLHSVAPSSLSLTPSSSCPRRGRKLCRWRRKALINTTVSDRYADPRHCKMAAISPSHSSGRQPPPCSRQRSPRPPSTVHWTPEGVSASRSLPRPVPTLSRHPRLAPPQLALLIFTPQPRRRRQRRRRRRRQRHRHTKSRGWKYATLPPIRLSLV